MSGTLPLASIIASHDREALSMLVRGRRIAAPAQVVDPIDLASELLKLDSITRALAGLTRTELVDLVAVERHSTPQTTSALLTLGLIAQDSVTRAPLALPEVSAALSGALEARGLTREDLGSAIHPPMHDDATSRDVPDAAGWFAPALTATAQCAWVLREFDRAPAKLNRGGSIASTWLKATEERLHVPRIDELLPVLRAASLLTESSAEVTPNAREWLQSAHEDRWITLARAAVSTAPKQLIDAILSGALWKSPAPHAAAAASSLLSGPAEVSAAVAHAYPLIEDSTRSAITHTMVLWQRLGLVFHGTLTPQCLELVEGAFPPAAVDFPHVAEGIYIQPDLSVVVPGPLSPEHEASLSSLAVPEQIGVASTMRITDASLSEALDRGVEADEIRNALEQLSLTGIPQPLAYLITSLSERAGAVVVSEHHGDSGRSRIDFARPDLRAMIQVDRSLTHLQLHEPATSDLQPSSLTSTSASGIPPLFSRLRADHVLAALIDARYPARAHSTLGDAADPLRLRSLSPRQPDATEHAPDPIEQLIDRVLASAADGPGDISRQITLAIRDRRPVQVTVEIRGDRRDFSLLPVSLSAGRMRALDEAAGVERTFPLDAITEVVAQ